MAFPQTSQREKLNRLARAHRMIVEQARARQQVPGTLQYWPGGAVPGAQHSGAMMRSTVTWRAGRAVLLPARAVRYAVRRLGKR